MNALILVDIQNDFLPTGPLAVPDGNAVIPVANRLMPLFDLVVATQDWHPRDHGSFAANHAGKKPGDEIELDGLKQILWPVHCVEDTPGAEFAPGLDSDAIQRVFRKGTDRNIDSYSGFYDNGHRKSTGLGDFLREKGVANVVTLGLATDYCVKFTALDGRKLDFAVTLVVDGCRGVNLDEGDVERALAEMKDAGVEIETSDSVVRRLKTGP